ncbi:MAG: DUF4396 domain-containing protein [Candidatus Eremiobacteraeota bacterium]|nr:DUF4396 domain-containing protein [Candidatus Eremiobacteraeota bacterium]
MLDSLLWLWVAAVAISVAYVAWDAWNFNPEVPVMKFAFVLVTLYTGPLGLILYILACKEPFPGTHEQFIKPIWKQAAGSTMHCLAGDATGIIVAAAITTSLRLPMWLDIISEYALGFAFGWFIFQALFMKNMMGGSYPKALRMSFIPEWLSMNTMMGGMIAVMVILMSWDMRAMDARNIEFWMVMSFAAIVGGIVAYPINYWMVDKGIKHGMMTDNAKEAENVRRAHPRKARQPA